MWVIKNKLLTYISCIIKYKERIADKWLGRDESERWEEGNKDKSKVVELFLRELKKEREKSLIWKTEYWEKVR